MAKKNETALDRVKNEKAELDEKIEKLSNLLGKVRTENWEAHKKLLDKLTNEQKKLLAKQLKVMKEYSKILGKRIKIWVDE